MRNKTAAAASSIQNNAAIALMTAIICIVGPLTLPIGPVPISLTPFTICISVYVLGKKRGTIACALYLLIGLIGLPVFSGYSAGPAVLFGPTGGYLIGYVVMSFISGHFIDRFSGGYAASFIGMVIGLAALYVIGTLWLSYSTQMSLAASFAAGVAPFILFDLLKIVLSIVVGSRLRSRLGAIGYVPG